MIIRVLCDLVLFPKNRDKLCFARPSSICGRGGIIKTPDFSKWTQLLSHKEK